MFTTQADRSVRSNNLQIVVPHYFNTEENLEYIRTIPNAS